jgi:DNA (cytosine-5)-methyltransferase 1
VTQLVLSLFPGIGLLDRAFEEEGFCIVRGPDLLWGGDIHNFHPPARRFDGVIGGPPCQAFTGFANFAKIRFGNLIPEFSRVVEEADPEWFLMENIPEAPRPVLREADWCIDDLILDNAQLGERQRRKRRFTFGTEYPREPLKIDLPDSIPDDAGTIPPVTGAHPCHRRPKGGHGENRSIGEMLEQQGLPATFFDESPLTSVGKRKLIGNGVPLPMGRAVAKAVKRALEQR